MNNLLSRHAESIFWLARQVERAISTARIFDVNESFSSNARGEHDWESMLRLYGDERNFQATGRKAPADAVIHFYILDDGNPNSVLSNIRMARENARGIFDPFFTTKETRGTGLGLSVVHKILDNHRASIGVDSVPGRGTTFTMVFPQSQGGGPGLPFRMEVSMDTGRTI